MSRAVPRLAALLGLTLVAAGLTACGDSGPLSGTLNKPQRHQLNAAWTARIAVTDTATISASERNKRASELYQACQQVAPGKTLLVAVVGTCKPVATTEKLRAVLPSRCDRPTAQCVRALDRLAQATDELAAADKALNAEVAQATDDPACRAQLTTSPAQLQALSDLSAAYRTFALGVEQKATDIAALGRTRITGAQKLLTPSGTVAARTAAVQKACGINDEN